MVTSRPYSRHSPSQARTPTPSRSEALFLTPRPKLELLGRVAHGDPSMSLSGLGRFEKAKLGKEETGSRAPEVRAPTGRPPMSGSQPPPEPLPERLENRERALHRGQVPRPLATPQLGPRYLPLRRLQLRGRCRRLRLTRPRPTLQHRSGAGPSRGAGRVDGGGPWLGPPSLRPPVAAGHPGCGLGTECRVEQEGPRREGVWSAGC